MRIAISHATLYRYTEPLMGSSQYLRLTPRSGPGQTVNRWKLACPGAELTEWTDHFGNVCHTLIAARALDRLTVEVVGEVVTADINGVVPAGQTDMPHEVYLRDSTYAAPDVKLAKFAAGFRRAVAADRIEGLHRVMSAIRDAVDYQIGETQVTTTAAEAYRRGRGVCQDHAHVFLAVARQLGVPARYVSGYLARQEGTRQESASHAWAEAAVADLGWVSFDCANGISATEAYVRLAVGLDYADAGPIRGVRMGGGEEKLTVKLDVSGRGRAPAAPSPEKAEAQQ
jgi:transglutaminase-like putative cysteine protease